LKAQNGLRPQELEQARIDFERTRDEYQRMKYLNDRKSLSANDFQKYEAAYLAASQRYEMAKQGTRSEEKLVAGAQSRSAGAQMQEARKRLSDCRLVAPISGFIGMKKINVGDTVAAGSPVFSVLDLDPVKVRVGVPEAEIGKIATGARATISLPSLGGKQFEGRLEALGVAADSASRTYTAKIAVSNPAHLLREGMVSQAQIFGSAMVNALTVPGSAIVNDARGVTQVYVYYPAQQRVYARRVELGSFIGNEVEVKSGLNPSDRVVIAGQQNVREGSPVRVIEESK
jgi:RND family efflux transporter MFP subunit